MRIHSTKTLECHPSDLTVEALMDFLKGESPNASVSFNVQRPDRPGGLSKVSITIRSNDDQAPVKVLE